jgi:hypothetical protein
MGNACSEVDTSIHEEEVISNAADEFLSQYKMRVHASTDPIARSSVFTFIKEEYEQEFNAPCAINLHRYYNTS